MKHLPTIHPLAAYQPPRLDDENCGGKWAIHAGPADPQCLQSATALALGSG
jgi:hypothetical protein